MMQTPPETMPSKESTDSKTKSVDATSVEDKKEGAVSKRDESPKAASKDAERSAGNGGEPMDTQDSSSDSKAKTPPEAVETKPKPVEQSNNSKEAGSVKNSKSEAARKSPSEEVSAAPTTKSEKAKETATVEEPMDTHDNDDKTKDDDETAEKEKSVEPKEEKPAPARRGRKRKADIEEKQIEVETSVGRPKRTREVAQEESTVEKRSGRKRAAKPESSMKEAAGSDEDEYRESEQEEEDDEDDEPKKKKRGRGRPPKSGGKPAVVKQPKVTGPTIEIPAVEGKTIALSAGDGEVGQLGIGESGENGKSRFVAIGDIPDKVVRCAAGGMHSLLLTEKGEIYSFGCNDDGSLGRPTDCEEECFVPKLTKIAEPVAKLAAGNIHSVAITKRCKVYIWGSYRDNNGSFGIQPEGDAPLKSPTELKVPEAIVDVACGSEHTLLLSDKGNIFSMGCGEQGRLGRLKSSHCSRENRRARQTLLTPVIVPVRKRKIVKFDRIWAGRYNSFARSTDGSIWGCGLNNYGQLGEVDSKSMEDNFVFFMVELKSFDPSIKWEQISGGEQHTLALDADGSVYSMGRVLYGRLGLGKKGANDPDVTKPTLIPDLAKKCTLITAGDHTSFAIDKEGKIWSWGQGTNLLGQGSRDDADGTDVFVPTVCTSKALREAKVVFASAGSNHALCVVKCD